MLALKVRIFCLMSVILIYHFYCQRLLSLCTPKQTWPCCAVLPSLSLRCRCNEIYYSLGPCDLRTSFPFSNLTLGLVFFFLPKLLFPWTQSISKCRYIINVCTVHNATHAIIIILRPHIRTPSWDFETECLFEWPSIVWICSLVHDDMVERMNASTFFIYTLSHA